MRTLALLASALLSAASIHAAVQPSNRSKPYAVLQVTYYDGSVDYEVLKTKELPLRARELWSEFPSWQEAYFAAYRQWTMWYRERTAENRGRKWVLRKPRKPHLRQMGTFADEIDAADQAEKLNATVQERRNKAAQGLWRNARRNWQTLTYLSNYHENAKLVRAMLPEARKKLDERDRKVAARLSDKKKRELWNLVHQAEYRARELLAEKKKDENGKPAKPDILEVHNKTQELLKPILARYRLNEWQWYVIWEEGHLAKWPVPPAPTAAAANRKGGNGGRAVNAQGG
jgi:hypothetical protein